MHLLGVCRHRYTHDDRCGLTVVQTRFGPGHVAPPRAAHYPVLEPPDACVHGHEFTPENTYIRPDRNSRVCRTCRVVSVGAAKREQRRVRRDNPLVYDATFIERFWARVDKSGECWVWTGARTHSGYGEIWHTPTARMLRAHRVAWELTTGDRAGELDVLHACDNPPCCNPAHLTRGTRADNNADRSAKGRTRNGWTGSLSTAAPVVQGVADPAVGGPRERFPERGVGRSETAEGR